MFEVSPARVLAQRSLPPKPTLLTRHLFLYMQHSFPSDAAVNRSTAIVECQRLDFGWPLRRFGMSDIILQTRVVNSKLGPRRVLRELKVFRRQNTSPRGAEHFLDGLGFPQHATIVAPQYRVQD